MTQFYSILNGWVIFICVYVLHLIFPFFCWWMFRLSKSEREKQTLDINTCVWNLEKWYAAAAAKSLQPCLTLCNPIDGNPPGLSIPRNLQARVLEWVAMSFSNAYMHAKALQLCPTLCDSMNRSPPGFSRQEYWSGLPFSSLKNGIDDLICKGEIETQM